VSRGRITILRVAHRELLDAVAWYDHESAKAGDRLLQEANEGLEKILANPEAYNFTYFGTRAYQLPSFPYLIYYLKRDATLLVFAFFHEKEDSLRLHHRLK
jgi:plasmid stabilization system protein ParE